MENKKGRKALVLGAALLLVGGASVFTYAKYYSQASSGNTTVTAAAWVVKANNTNIVTEHSFGLGNIDWTSTGNSKGASNVAAGTNTIAPGAHGTFSVTVDATGSETLVDYNVALGTISGLPAGMTVTPTSANTTDTIDPSSATKTATVTYTVDWPYDDNTTPGVNDADDTAFQGHEFNINVTVTATQHPAA